MNSETILIVEDEEDIASLIAHHMETAGFKAIVVANGGQAFKVMETQMPDLIILDLMLPDMDGTEFCKRIKANRRTRDIPVIMVTAKGEEVDRVVGLELGADDYVVKPFSTRELTLRVKGVLRRTKSPVETKAVLNHGDLMLDIDAHKVTVGLDRIELTLTEFNLLHDLLINKGRVRSREALLNHVWGYTFEGYERTVDSHIQRLRKKIGDRGKIIQTVRGIGYTIRDDEIAREELP